MKNIFNNLDKLISDYQSNLISKRSAITLIKKHFIDEIIYRTEYLNMYDVDIDERIFNVLNDKADYKCPYCDNKKIWSGRLNIGYRDTCGNKDCTTKHLHNLKFGSNVISVNRESIFIERQKCLKYIDDKVIIENIKYDRHINLITNELIIEYLRNRFSDSDSLLESYQRIKFGIEMKPKCPTCGKPVKWIGKKSKLYTIYCSVKCSSNNPLTTDKRKKTLKEKWGTDGAYDSETYKLMMTEKFGVEYSTQREEFKKKRKDTLLMRYGTLNLYQVEEIKQKIIQKNLEKFGYDCAFKSPYVRDKIYSACKRNGTLGTSKAEDVIFGYFKELGIDVERFHRDEIFPFNVDFYCAKYDLYIEFQGSQFHRGRPFKGSETDIKELEELQRMHLRRISESGRKDSQYARMIYVWSDLDVRKRELAKTLGIKYLEIYSCDSKEDLYRLICPYIDNISLINNGNG